MFLGENTMFPQVRFWPVVVLGAMFLLYVSGSIFHTYTLAYVMTNFAIDMTLFCQSTVYGSNTPTDVATI